MEKLFYQDTHITDFEAVVTACAPHQDGTYHVTLNRTAFFPEEGGQGADAGTLEGLQVLDVQIKDGEIYHVLPSMLAEGTLVKGHVDWEQRFDYMQQHSGEHILSGLVHAKYGYDNVGFHLGKEEVTMDFNGCLSLDELLSLEALVNQIIWRDVPVKAYFPSPDELKSLSYRSKLELTEDVRIVEIPGVDLCACCAPHVDSTGQIGLFKIMGVQSHRGGVRINILCGKRAMTEFNKLQNSVISISQLLSVKQDLVYEGVTALKEENQSYRLRTNELQARLLEAQTALLPSPDQQENVVLFTGELDNIALRNTVNSLCAKYKGYCCLFSGSDAQGYRFIIGSAASDCRTIASLLRDKLQAKGGGTAPMVQGSLRASQNEILAALEQLVRSFPL